MTDIQNIVAKAGILFKKYGIKSVSMDDLAGELGISKKTLYQIIADKKALVTMVIQSEYNYFRQMIENISSIKNDPVMQFIKLHQLISEFLKGLSLAVEYDLKKYYANVYNKFRAEYITLFTGALQANIQLGKQLGVYRSDADDYLISRIQVLRLDHNPQNTLFTELELTSPEFQREQCLLNIKGLVNSKGELLLEKYWNNIENVNK